MEAFFIIIAIVVFVFFIVDGFRSHSKKYGKGKYRNDSDPSPTGSFFGGILQTDSMEMEADPQEETEEAVAGESDFRVRIGISDDSRIADHHDPPGKSCQEITGLYIKFTSTTW